VSDPDQLRSLLVPAAPGRLEAYPVSTAVNRVRNNGAQLLDPLPAEPPLRADGRDGQADQDAQPEAEDQP
jgi:hypothetical protein